MKQSKLDSVKNNYLTQMSALFGRALILCVGLLVSQNLRNSKSSFPL